MTPYSIEADDCYSKKCFGAFDKMETFEPESSSKVTEKMLEAFHKLEKCCQWQRVPLIWWLNSQRLSNTFKYASAEQRGQCNFVRKSRIDANLVRLFSWKWILPLLEEISWNHFLMMYRNLNLNSTLHKDQTQKFSRSVLTKYKKWSHKIVQFVNSALQKCQKCNSFQS